MSNQGSHDGVYGCRHLKIGDKKFLAWYLPSPGVAPVKEYRIYLTNFAGDEKNNMLVDTVHQGVTQWEVPEKYYEHAFFIHVVYQDGTERGQGQVEHLPVYVPGALGEPDYHSIKYPQWFTQIPARQQTALLNQAWFNAWLKITPVLDSDCRHVYRDNSKYADRLVWRSDKRVLFHGDEMDRAPDEIFEMGMFAYQSVVGPMQIRQESLGGDIVSYSYLFDSTIAAYATPYNPNAKGRYLYVTVPGQAGKAGLSVDMTDSGQEGAGAEVAFLSGLRRDYILGAFEFPKPGPGVQYFTPTAFHINPNAAQYSDLEEFLSKPEMTMLIFSSTPQSDISLTVTLSAMKVNSIITIDEKPQLVNTNIFGEIVLKATSTSSGKDKKVSWYINNTLFTGGEKASSITVPVKEWSLDRMMVIYLHD